MLSLFHRFHPRRSLSLAIAALAAGITITTEATADVRDATCQRVRAEAESEAALLYAPRIQLEGARAPGVVSAGDPAAAVDGLQARVVLALSPLDMMRGRAVERLADAECARERLAGRLDHVLALGDRHGELDAARAELAYLDAHAGEIDALVSEVVDRFERQRATALEVAELRGRRAAVRRRVAELHHTHAVLEALDTGVAPPSDLSELARAHDAAALEVDRRKAAVRGLEAWRFDVRGGVAGADRADWFAVVEVGYSFGQPWQRGADRRAVRARAAELTGDDRAVTVRLARLQAAMRGSVAALEVELAAIDDELAVLRVQRDRLDGLDSEAARPLRARLTVELIELEARRTAVQTLVEIRRPLGGAS
ncbi:MAG TPA: hypothetical protein VM261_25635 [Kofleriaceae bacterium]|nr:hypothetical protein [Kofleriaceae bacterium]